MIVFDIIVDMLFNKKLQQVVTELFVRCKKQNIYLVFITPSYFSVPTLLVQYLGILLFEKEAFSKFKNTTFLFFKKAKFSYLKWTLFSI